MRINELNPRYKLYLKINPNPKNWEYVNWIGELASRYRKKIGVDRYHSISHDPNFDLYLNNEVNKTNDPTTVPWRCAE